MSDGDTCIWQAWGEVKCKVSEKFNGLEEFYGYIDQDGYYTTDTDPRTDPNCAKYGCPEGRACASSGDCANGLSCRQNVCTKFSPFHSRNAKEIRDASVNDNSQQRSDDERQYYTQITSPDRGQADLSYGNEDLIWYDKSNGLQDEQVEPPPIEPQIAPAPRVITVTPPPKAVNKLSLWKMQW